MPRRFRVEYQPRVEEPGDLVTISQSALTEGLLGVYVASVGPILLGGSRPLLVKVPAPLSSNVFGLALAGNASGASYTGLYVPPSATAARFDLQQPPATLFGIGSTNVNGGQGFVYRGNGSSLPSYSLGGWYGSFRGAHAELSLSGGTLDFSPGSAIFDTRIPFIAVLSIGVSTTTIYAYQGGRLVDERSLSTPSGTFANQFNDEYRTTSFAGGWRASASVVMGGVIAGKAWTKAESARFADNPWQLFAPRRIIIPVSAVGGGSGIVAANGVATTSAMAGASVAASSLSSASGVATASALAGASTAASAITAAAGVATASALTGVAGAGSTIAPAAGAATASAITASSVAVAAFTAAAGVATPASLAGRSTASASFGVAAGVAASTNLAGASAAAASFGTAAGVATASTLTSVVGGSAISPASGMAVCSVLAGSSIVVSAFSPAAGVATTSAMSSADASVIPTMPPYITVFMWRRTA